MTRLLAALAAAALLAAPAAARAVDIALTHSGYLLDANDLPMSAPQAAFVFRLYKTKLPGDTSDLLIYETASCDLAVSKGFYSTVLGDSCTGAEKLTDANLPPDQSRYLEVTVNSVKLLPRMLIGIVPNAAVAAKSLDTQALTTLLAATGTLNTPTNPVDWTQLKSLPAGFADGVDHETVYTAGTGLVVQASDHAGTVALADTNVTPGEYLFAKLTVDQQGRITAAEGRTAVTSIAAGTGLTGGTITATGTLGIAPGGVTATELAANAVTAGKIADNAVGTAQLIDATIAAADLASDAASLSRISGGAMVLNSGKLGLGATAPVQRFEIQGTPTDANLLVHAVGVGSGGIAAGLAGANGASVVANIGENLRFGHVTWNGNWSTSFNEKARFDPAGNFGIGTATPAAKLDIATGGFRTKNMGKLTVINTATASTVTLPAEWTPAYVLAHIGESYAWVAEGPSLRGDIGDCGSGNHGGHGFICDAPEWGGRYSVTLYSVSGSPAIAGSRQGWHSRLLNRSNGVVADGVGAVNFTLHHSGTVWTLQHMNGQVDVTPFECR